MARIGGVDDSEEGGEGFIGDHALDEVVAWTREDEAEARERAEWRASDEAYREKHRVCWQHNRKHCRACGADWRKP